MTINNNNQKIISLIVKSLFFFCLIKSEARITSVTNKLVIIKKIKGYQLNNLDKN